jgi:NAD(P)H-nitrite reductase large subunit
MTKEYTDIRLHANVDKLIKEVMEEKFDISKDDLYTYIDKRVVSIIKDVVSDHVNKHMYDIIKKELNSRFKHYINDEYEFRRIVKDAIAQNIVNKYDIDFSERKEVHHE